jgi:hypothetical protein
VKKDTVYFMHDEKEIISRIASKRTKSKAFLCNYIKALSLRSRGFNGGVFLQADQNELTQYCLDLMR